ncbi:MAG TPA: hypothetical protein VJ762_00115 [Sphingobium sp.]|nr:hypothetical protein [Sphingobium sp.]
MTDSDSWSVDRLAANNLLAHLGLEATADTLERVERHFAQHRRTAMEWATQRVHATIIDRFEAASQDYFLHHSEEWTEGFRFAEQQVAGMTARDLLQTDPGQPQSKGQILRHLVRHARRSL